MSVRYRVNAPTVTFEAIDGEVVIINLDTGSYYSLTGTGAEVWVRLAEGVAVAGIAGELAQRYDATVEITGHAVEALVADLAGEHLILADGIGPADVPGASVATGAPRAPFVAPVWQRFTDMQDLLLLDPVHDVTEAGWPHKE